VHGVFAQKSGVGKKMKNLLTRRRVFYNLRLLAEPYKDKNSQLPLGFLIEKNEGNGFFCRFVLVYRIGLMI
jgi:hypothetical protein